MDRAVLGAVAGWGPEGGALSRYKHLGRPLPQPLGASLIYICTLGALSGLRGQVFVVNQPYRLGHLKGEVRGR